MQPLRRPRLPLGLAHCRHAGSRRCSPAALLDSGGLSMVAAGRARGVQPLPADHYRDCRSARHLRARGDAGTEGRGKSRKSGRTGRASVNETPDHAGAFRGIRAIEEVPIVTPRRAGAACRRCGPRRASAASQANWGLTCTKSICRGSSASGSSPAVHAAIAKPPCIACCQTWPKTLLATAVFSSLVNGGVGSSVKILSRIDASTSPLVCSFSQNRSSPAS